MKFIEIENAPKGKIIAGTGHRPDKLGGYDRYESEVLPQLIDLARCSIQILEPTQVISGMALGWDTALAQAALIEKIPLLAAVPGKWFPDRWSQKQKDRYIKILRQADEVAFVDELPGYAMNFQGYSASKLQKRNQYMSDNADLMLALWNGTRGGTFNNLEYAQRLKMPVVNVWDRWDAA